MKTSKKTRDELRAAITSNGAVAMSMSMLTDLLDDVDEAERQIGYHAAERDSLVRVGTEWRTRANDAEAQVATLKSQYDNCCREREAAEKKVHEQDLVGRDEVVTARKRLDEITVAADELRSIFVTDSYVRSSSRIGRAISKFLAVVGETDGMSLPAIVECCELRDALGKMIAVTQRVISDADKLGSELQTDLYRALDYARRVKGDAGSVVANAEGKEPFMDAALRETIELREQLQLERANYQVLCDDKAGWVHRATAAEKESKALRTKLRNIAAYVDKEAE